jgi:hypothetical protein
LACKETKIIIESYCFFFSLDGETIFPWSTIRLFILEFIEFTTTRCFATQNWG